jgi:hypothetical protein
VLGLPGANKVEITRVVVIVKVTAEFRYSYFIVFTVLSMKLYVTIVVKEYNLYRRKYDEILTFAWMG